MKAVDEGADWVSAPQDYAALFRQYYSYIVSLVRKYGIDEERKEDVASEIVTRLMERDMLHVFDASMVFLYEGQERPARFKSFLTKLVMMYVLGHRDRQHRQSTREMLLCDKPIGDGNAIAWVDVYGGLTLAADDDALDGAEGQELVEELRSYLRRVPRRSPYDGCDLVTLFDLVVAQVRDTGRVDHTALREHFGIGATALHSWMWWLRANLCHARGLPVPAKAHHTAPRPAG